MKLWKNIDISILDSLPNTAVGYEQRITIPEFTFLGKHNQPDFGSIKLWFYGQDKTIELKSLKNYIFQYRDTVISYERCIDVLYKHLMETYQPVRLRVQIDFRPRGGISSCMTADSDWGHLGGTDKLWQDHKD
jgi:7-cyano-7-deazaguanine reductase